MVKKNWKKKLGSNVKELAGFEHILDILDEEDEIAGIKKQGPAISKKKAENFDLYNLLEYESTRLEMLNRFWGIKVPNLQKYSQIKSLIEKRKNETEKKKTRIIEKLTPSFSPFQNSLKNIFESSFISEIKKAQENELEKSDDSQ